MKAEAIEEASNGLKAIINNVKSLLDNPEGIAELSSKPAKNFMPAIGIYAKLLTKHGLDNMKDFDKMCQLQASKFGCEDAVEAFWNIEEDYEKIIKRADQALDLRPQETNVISKIGEIAPIGAVLTDGRYSRRNLDMHINFFAKGLPLCTYVLIAISEHFSE